MGILLGSPRVQPTQFSQYLNSDVPFGLGHPLAYSTNRIEVSQRELCLLSFDDQVRKHGAQKHPLAVRTGNPPLRNALILRSGFGDRGSVDVSAESRDKGVEYKRFGVGNGNR